MNKLKNMKLNSVDFVPKGANQHADIELFKSAPEVPAREGVFKSFVDWLTKGAPGTFEQTLSTEDMRGKLWQYFIADPDRQPAVMQALEERYGGDVYLHENTWPGLFGILSAMQMLMRLLYGVIAAFVLLTTLSTTGKLLRAERRDMAIYRSVGFPAGALRRSFAVRFGLTVLLGSAFGTLLSGLCSDPLVAVLMRLEGISNYASHPGMAALLLPGAVVTLLFTGFAWMAAGQIRTVPLTMLTVE